MITKIEQLAKELKEYYDYIGQYDAVKFLCRFNNKYRTYVTIAEALKAWKLAY